MNKEDILKRSREENKNGDEREEKIKLRSYATSSAIGALICMVFILLEEFVFNRSTTHIWIIYSGIMFSKHLIDAYKLKKKEDVAFSIIYGAICLINCIIYVIDIVRG